MTEFVNLHTHKTGEGICILDISDGKIPSEGILCSAGIHPLYSEKGWNMSEIWAMAGQGRLVAIGEAGLDRNSALTMERQIMLFEEQIALSEQFGLPLIIHCVRAFPELFTVYKRTHPVQAWIIHGYNNNAEILREALRHGLYVSVGKALMNEKSNAWELLPDIPAERLFLETDDSDYTIREIYEQAVIRRRGGMEVLKTDLYDNFKRVFEKLKC